MNKEQALAKLAEIKPGKNYPTMIRVTETVKGKVEVVKFLLQSYFVGMYCAIYIGEQVGSMPIQTGDYNNKGFVTKLKKDIVKAIERGADVEFGSILPVKTDMN